MFHAIILTDTFSFGAGLRPLGAYSIANEIRNNGFTAIVINYISHLDKDTILELINKFVSKETMVLGYSSSLFQTSSADMSKPSNFLPWDKDFFRSVNISAKKNNPNLKVIFGGSCSRRLTKYNLAFNDSLGVDYVFHGYSERMIIDFLENIKNNRDHHVSSNIYGLREIDYDTKGSLFDFRTSKHTWQDIDFISMNEALPLEVARGCIFKCKFCAYPLLGKHPKDNSYIRLENNILNEILENYDKFKTTTYFIVDDTFNERSDKIEMLLRIRDKSKINLNFVGYNRLDLLCHKPNQIEMLKDLNFKGLFFGIESMNYDSARSIGKGLKTDKMKETLYQIKDIFPECSITSSFIIGLPFETNKTLSEWVPWVTSKDCPIDTPVFNPLSLTFNSHSQSEFDKDPGKYGYVRTSNFGAWKNEHWDSKECKEVSEKIMQECIKSGRTMMSGMWAANITKLGYDYDDSIKIPLKTVYSNEFQSKLEEKIDNYIKSYAKKLISLRK